MDKILQLNIPVWMALLILLCLSLAMLGIYWLGTTAEERELERRYKRFAKAQEARQPRVLR